MPVETIPPTTAQREELFSGFNSDPHWRVLDPFMRDSTGIVAQAISDVVSSHYGGISIWNIQAGIDLLIHHEVGQSRQESTGRTPFINEALVAYYLTHHSPSVVLLDVGADQLPPVRGLVAILKRFDEIVQGNEDPDLRRFQAAVPFRNAYTDPYSEVQSELVQDRMSFRLKVISDMIRVVVNRDPRKTQELKRLRHSLSYAFNYDGLRVEYGNPRDNIADAVPSCITGLVGTVREAALTYEVDPNIEIIGLYPYLESPVAARLGVSPVHMDQIVKGITVKVFDREADDEVKLVVDGVIAADNLGEILGLDWRSYMAIGLLEYARSKGIRHVVINAENGESHESMKAFTYFIATECLGLKEGRDFSYDADIRTGNHEFRLQSHHMKNNVDGFSYTHHLEKDPIPEEMVRALAASSIYKGESYFETWYSWMTHVHNRGDAWDSALRTRFPYVEQRSISMKPAWNLGRGPMVGMELDVFSILAKLYQQYL